MNNSAFLGLYLDYSYKNHQIYFWFAKWFFCDNINDVWRNV